MVEMFRLKPEWHFEVVDSAAFAWWKLTDPEIDRYDLLITDLRIPNGSGLDLLRRVRSDRQTSSLKVLICSANKDREVMVQMIKQGTSDYILKPYIPREMLQKVGSILADVPHRRIDLALGTEGGDEVAVGSQG